MTLYCIKHGLLLNICVCSVLQVDRLLGGAPWVDGWLPVLLEGVIESWKEKHCYKSPTHTNVKYSNEQAVPHEYPSSSPERTIC